MQSELMRPIVGIENRTAKEVFDIMCDRFRAEFGNEESPRYTTRRLHEEIRKAEERGRQHEREAALSAAEQQTAPSVAGEIADAVLSWMVEYDLLDAGNEYRAAEVIAVLDDFKPSYHAALSAQVQDVAKLDADEIAAAISTAACELGDVPDPEGDDTISITVRDLEAIAHRHITVAIDRAATPAKQEG